MVETKAVQLTPEKIFKITLRNLFAPWFLIFIALIWLLCFSSLRTYTPAEIVVCFIPFLIYIPLVLLILWHNAYSKKNKIFYRERVYRFDEKCIAYTMPDAQEGKINWSMVIKLKKRPEYYLIYLSKNQFFYVPMESFKTETDLQKFEKILKSHHLLK